MRRRESNNEGEEGRRGRIALRRFDSVLKNQIISYLPNVAKTIHICIKYCIKLWHLDWQCFSQEQYIRTSTRHERHPFEFLDQSSQLAPKTMKADVFGCLSEVEGKFLYEDIIHTGPRIYMIWPGTNLKVSLPQSSLYNPRKYYVKYYAAKGGRQSVVLPNSYTNEL